jgi:hypothetical protein
LNDIKLSLSSTLFTKLLNHHHMFPIVCPALTRRFDRGKGFLAADESGGPWLRARHAEAAKIPDTGPLIHRYEK